MVNWKSRKLGDLLLLANGLVILVLISQLSSIFFFRLDLTDEKRFTIKEPTREILRNLDEPVYVEVYLAGELNSGLQRFQKAIRETLEEFSIHAGTRFQYAFVDPAAAMSQKARSEFMADLARRGVQPSRVVDTKDGQRIEKIIFPGAVISYGASETGVHLLKGNKARSFEEEINQSIEGIEFELANALYKLRNDDVKKIGIVTGHGEPENQELAGLQDALREVYQVDQVALQSGDLQLYDALVIAKPSRAFPERDKFRLDQYVMGGGGVLFLLDRLDANMDSISLENYFAFPYNLGLDDLLFRYGIRINPDLVQDRSAGRYPVVTGQSGNRPQIRLMDWEFFPLINNYANHPITHNLDAVVLHFASSLDTVKADGVNKTPLFFTSLYSRKVVAPVDVSIQTLRKNVRPEHFNESAIPLAYLLEGTFTSLYKNRFVPEGEDAGKVRESGRSRIIVVGDGDIAKNAVDARTGQPYPLGFDRFNEYTFSNSDLLMNMLAYLTDENGLIRARNKEIRIRPLDKTRIASEKVRWRLINLGVPISLLVCFGVIRNLLRRRYYTNYGHAGKEK